MSIHSAPRAIAYKEASTQSKIHPPPTHHHITNTPHTPTPPLATPKEKKRLTHRASQASSSSPTPHTNSSAREAVDYPGSTTRRRKGPTSTARPPLAVAWHAHQRPIFLLVANTLCILPEARPTKVGRYQVRNSSLPPRYIAGSQRRNKKRSDACTAGHLASSSPTEVETNSKTGTLFASSRAGSKDEAAQSTLAVPR